MNVLILCLILIAIAPVYVLFLIILFCLYGIASKQFNRLLNAVADLIHWFICGTKVE